MIFKIFKKKNIEKIDDKWIHFLREKKSFLNVFRLNYAFKDIFPLKWYKYFFVFSLNIKNLKKEKLKLIYKIEDKVSSVLERKSDVIFVWAVKFMEKFELYFYAKDTSNLCEYVDNWMIEFSSFSFSTSFEKDKNWKKYEKLLPTNFEIERSLNEKKILEYQKKAKKIEKKKEVFYFVSFKNKKTFSYVKKEITSFWFNIVKDWDWRWKVYKYVVKLSKNTKIDLKELNSNTLFLCNLAEIYNFKYEWLIL